MNQTEARAFLTGKMEFTPQRMMRYIRSRARLSTDEDIEDILQTALILVTKHFDPDRADAKLSPYCLGACNKAIAQNLERYHKVVLKKRSEAKPVEVGAQRVESEQEVGYEGAPMRLKRLTPGQSFDDQPTAPGGQFRTTSLDTLFDEDDGRSAEDIFGWEYKLAAGGSDDDPAARSLIKDLIYRILTDLPEGIHRTCFLLKYVEGYKREDLISCLKMEPKSIDTIDKKIVRTLKAFKEKLDQDEASI